MNLIRFTGIARIDSGRCRWQRPIALPQPQCNGPRLKLWFRLFAATALAFLAGCGEEELQTDYGRRAGPFAAKSVNGTAVLADLFAQRGHAVFSRSSLGSWLDRTDCIVWFPDDFLGPPEPVRQALTAWLQEADDRLLIYVGRDYDAAPLYFDKVIPAASPEKRQEYELIKQFYAGLYLQRREAGAAGDYSWFLLEEAAPNRPVGPLSGAADWIEGIDQTRLEIRLGRRMIPPFGAAVLLASGDDVIVSSVPVGRGDEAKYPFGSRNNLVLVANGSFLLNMPLVNPEHRKLAARLIDMAGPSKRRVVFLESRPGGPPLQEEAVPERGRGGLEVVVRPPYLWIFLSALMLAAVFCVHYAMPFGPRKRLEDAPTTDFGRHLAAVAALLKRTGNRSYAMQQLLLYRQLIGEAKRGQSPPAGPLPTRAPPRPPLSKAAASLPSSDQSGREGR